MRMPARFSACAATVLTFAFALPWPLAAQQQPGGFSLPQPSPTPDPAPQGPADERAGVAIPPRTIPAPKIAPVPVLNREPAPEPPPEPAPRAAASPVPAPVPTPVPTPVPAAIVTANPAAPSGHAPAAASAAPPGDPLAVSPRLPDADQSSLKPPPALPEAARAEPTAPALPGWWPWAAGGLGGLAILAGGLALRRRRRRAITEPRLATPPPLTADHAPLPTLAQVLDLGLEMTGATRSMMMFTLAYRVTVSNRTGRAMNDLGLDVRLDCARSGADPLGADNAASPSAAQQLHNIERIGPHQSRSITGTVQLPVAGLAILRQGSAVMFIPLAHVTVKGEGQSVLTRSFVIGTPSTGGTGKLHPIRLDTPPGSIPGLRAQAIAIPAVSAAA